MREAKQPDSTAEFSVWQKIKTVTRDSRDPLLNNSNDVF